MTERQFAIDAVRTLQTAGFQALWAGGCVRDELLKLTPDDYDVASNATPDQVQKLFKHTIAIGASFGVIEVLGPKIDGHWRKVQVATFRSDGTYSDGRRPDSVTFGNAEEDAKRRDFTINGLFFDPVANQLIDYVGGQADLNAKMLRAIGDPIARFTEDKLRILRAVRMAARFELTIDPATLAAGRAMAPQIAAVSPERIAEELRKLLSHPNRGRGVELLGEFRLLPAILPEADRAFVERLPADASFALTLALMVRASDVKTVRAVAHRLKLSNEELDRIAWLVAMQSSLIAPLPKSKLYPILIHPGIGELLALHRTLNPENVNVAEAERIVNSTPRNVLDPPPLLTGDDLVARGWQPGPHFKTVLETVRAAQLDDQILQEQALGLADRLRQH